MLFGHQNDDTNNQNGAASSPVAAPPIPPPAPDAPAQVGVNPLAVDPATGASLPVVPADDASTSVEPTPPSEAASVTETEFTFDAPAPEAPTPQVPTLPDAADQTQTDVPAPDELLAMKQQALAQLSPLVSQLEQSAEEKFRTTMMLIQSTDNQNLLKDAYEAAQAIQDEKARAQALLDVVNEINYFTQQKTN